MEKIDDLQLDKLMAEAETALATERKDKVYKLLKHLCAEKMNCDEKVGRIKRDLAKAETQAKKVGEQVAKVRKGDWNAIPKEKKDKQGEQNEE